MMPQERAVGVARRRCTSEGQHSEEKAKPILALIPEAGPGNCARKMKVRRHDVSLFPKLPDESRDDVFIPLDLSTQTIVLAVMGVVGPTIAMHEQHLPPVGRKDVTERSQNGCEH